MNDLLVRWTKGGEHARQPGLSVDGEEIRTQPQAPRLAEAAKTGKLDLPKPTEMSLGSHAVTVAGHNDAKRVLVCNFSGSDWGTQGCSTIPYDYLSNPNLSDDFWTVRAVERQKQAGQDF